MGENICYRKGNWIFISQSAYLSSYSKIGNGVILNPGVGVHHDSSVGDYSLIYANSVVRTMSNVEKKLKLE